MKTDVFEDALKMEIIYIMMDKLQTKVKVLMSQPFIDDMLTTLKMAGKDKSITGAIEAGVLSTKQQPQYRRICVFVGLAWTVPFQKSFVSDLRSHQNVFVNSKTTRYCGLISCLFCPLSSPYFASTTEFHQYNSLSIRRASSLGLPILRIVHNQRKGTTVKFRK